MKNLLMVLGIGCSLVASGAATYEPNGQLGAGPDTHARSLSCFCLDGSDNLITADDRGRCLRIVSPDDKLLAKWSTDFPPQAVAYRAADKAVLAAGGGQVAFFDAHGKVLAAGSYATVQPPPGRPAYVSEATAVAASGDDVFVCHRTGTGYVISRLTAALDKPAIIVKGLRGCCGQMDMTARDGTIYVAANCDGKIRKFDREGKENGSFGKPAGAPNLWEGCCEPKNVSVAADGTLYVSESAQCAVSHFTADGQLLGRVGVVRDIGGCVRVTVAANRDASRVYLLDPNRNVVRILAPKS